MKPALLVLAAGMGSRYGGLKQIDPIGENGETIIDFSIFDAINSGFNKVVFVIRKDIERDFREIIGKRYENKINVEYVFQKIEDIPEGFKPPEHRAKPWGTGHAILCAHSSIDAPFAVINGDDFYGRDSFRLLADYLVRIDIKSNTYAIVAYILKNTLSEYGYVSRGVCNTNADNYLKSIVENTKIKKSDGKIYAVDEYEKNIELNGNEFVSMNMFGFTPGIFGHLDRQFRTFLKEKINDNKSEFFIPTVINNLIKSNTVKVEVLHSSNKWLGITYKQDKGYVIKNIRDMIKANEYPKNLWDLL